MKRKTAKELLAESFKELAENKNIDKITVKDITENCGYSSATFYRQFKDKYDLIAWAYTRDLENILDALEYSKASWKQVLTAAAKYYSEQKDYLANLLLHTNGYDSFVTHMTHINSEALRLRLAKAAGCQTPDEMTAMYIRVYCCGTVQLTCEWILGQYAASPEELAQVYEDTLPEPLQRYLR